MDDEILKIQIGANIAKFRKHRGLTQAELAGMLNYSDKAVSKWERGESVPDVVTLVSLAEVLEVTVNDLLRDPNALPEGNGKVHRAVDMAVKKTLKRKANKNVIQSLSSILVWFVALLIFVVLSTLKIPYSELAFFYAVPINAIVLLSLRSAWRDFDWNRILISIIMWGFLAAIYLTLLIVLKFNVWKIFLLGIPGQAAIILWFRMFRPMKNKETENG